MYGHKCTHEITFVNMYNLWIIILAMICMNIVFFCLYPFIIRIYTINRIVHLYIVFFKGQLNWIFNFFVMIDINSRAYFQTYHVGRMWCFNPEMTRNDQKCVPVSKNLSQFPKNVSWFPKNVSCFAINVSQF